jgi:hypothetical protein
MLPPIQEAVLDLDPRIVFCAAVDRNGYLPTHNRASFHSRSQTDPVWNAANCRNRRVFDDRVGLKAGRSTAPFLLQVYRRDMGGGTSVSDEGSVSTDCRLAGGTGAGCGSPTVRNDRDCPKKTAAHPVDGGGSGVSNDRAASQGRRCTRGRPTDAGDMDPGQGSMARRGPDRTAGRNEWLRRSRADAEDPASLTAMASDPNCVGRQASRGRRGRYRRYERTWDCLLQRVDALFS